MRIISGQFKGMKVYPPKNFKARPTTDFSRESICNLIANAYPFESLSVLDLFSGSGMMAYELASRGVKNIHCVDIDPISISFIIDNIKRFHLNGIVHPHKKDSIRYLKTDKNKYDIIFADPPYGHKESITIPDIVKSNELLNPGGILIIEHPKQIKFETTSGFYQQRNYGKSFFTLFKYS